MVNDCVTCPQCKRQVVVKDGLLMKHQYAAKRTVCPMSGQPLMSPEVKTAVRRLSYEASYEAMRMIANLFAKSALPPWHSLAAEQRAEWVKAAVKTHLVAPCEHKNSRGHVDQLGTSWTTCDDCGEVIDGPSKMLQ